MPSNQLGIPRVESFPAIITPPTTTLAIPEESECNLLMLATTNCRLQNQTQSHSNSPRRLTIESMDRSANNSRRQSLVLPKLSSKRPSVAINKMPLMK